MLAAERPTGRLRYACHPCTLGWPIRAAVLSDLEADTKRAPRSESAHPEGESRSTHHVGEVMVARGWRSDDKIPKKFERGKKVDTGISTQRRRREKKVPFSESFAQF